MNVYSRFKVPKEKEQKINVWIENNRTTKWVNMIGRRMERWDMYDIIGNIILTIKYSCRSTTKRYSKVKSRIRKGIPEAMRSLIWCKITDSCTLLQSNPGVYHEYITTEKDKTPYMDTILRDIGRTFPKHHMFVRYGKSGKNDINTSYGQGALSNVLKAYSLHDPTVGYCQGMAFIAALFLSYMPEEVPSDNT